MFRTFFFCCLFSCVSLPWVQAQEIPAPPHAYSATDIEAARDQVKRVGWSEGIIDNQIRITPQDPYKNVWKAAVKAALFGDEELMNRAVDRIEKTIEDWQEMDFQFKGEGEIPTSQAVFYLVQSYDCLTVCPEWEHVEKKRKANLRQSIQETVDRFLIPSHDDLILSSSVQFQTTRLYSSLISGSTQVFHLALQGDDEISSLETILRTGLTGEGLLLDAPIERHVVQSADLLTAGAALQSASPDAFERLSPWIQKTADIVTSLCSPSGNLPEMLGEINPALMPAMLERAFRLYGSSEYAELLRKVYRRVSRQGSHLLLGNINLENTPAAEHNTTAWPQTGGLTLHNPSELPFNAYLDTGLLSHQTRSNALLALELRTEQGALSGFQEEIGTEGYNTVLVDRKPHTPYDSSDIANGFLYDLKRFSDGSAYVNVTADDQYSERAAYDEESDIQPPVNYFQRTLFMCDQFLIDLFRVRGGQWHDYLYHSHGTIQSASNIDFQSIPPESNDLSLFTKADALQQAQAKDIYNIQFGTNEPETYTERLWFIDPDGSQLIAGSLNDQIFLTARRAMEEGESNLYSVIHEVRSAGQQRDPRIIRLPLDPSPSSRDFQAVAFAIESGDRVNICLSSTNPSVEYTTEYEDERIVFKGRFAHIRKINGEFKSLRLIGGRFLRFGTHGVDLEENMQVGVVSQVMQDKGALRIDFPHPLSVGNHLLGHSFFVATPNRGPSIFQPFIIKQLENNRSPQVVSLQHHPNLMDPPSMLGSPVENGDQVIYEHFAEMVRLSEDRFRLHYSAPMEVIVEGGTKRHRVMVKSTRVERRVRGESTVGVILFPVDPAERIDGVVEFTRIP